MSDPERTGASDLVEDKDEDGLTVFIPNRDRRVSLPRLIRSALDAIPLLEKKSFSAEVLVIDDASQDGSQKLLRSIQTLYDEPHLETVCLRRSLGPTGLRNLALGMSRFRYVCTMYYDSELAPGNLPAFLRSMRDTGAAMSYGNLIEKQDGEIIGMRSNATVAPNLIKFNHLDDFSIVDAEKLLKLGGYAKLHPDAPENWEMLLRLIAGGELILFVPAVLGYHHPSMAGRKPELSEDGVAALRQAYAPDGMDKWEHIQVGRIYYPDVGFVDEW